MVRPTTLSLAAAAPARGLASLLVLPLLAHGARHGSTPGARHEVRLLAAEGAHSDTHEGLHHAAINPALDPTSDKVFFKKDYPDDLRPTPSRDHMKKFDHPYPVVQDHETFDKDYVKDENSDNGEWQAQTEYDSLRTKLRGQQKVVNEAYRREQEDKHHLDDLEHEEHAAQEAGRKANEDAKKAAADADSAHSDVERLAGKAGEDSKGDEVSGAVGDAIDDVKDKMKHLQDCQKQLSDAKAELHRLIQKKEERKKEAEEARAAKASARSEAQAKVDKDNAEAAAKIDADVAKAEQHAKEAAAEARAVREAMDAKEKALEKKIAEAEAAHKAAMKAYEEEELQMGTAEAKLKEAAARVRKYRGEVGPDGAVYPTTPKKSGGPRAALAAPIGLAMLLAALQQLP
mmetsp:Transcript_20221/g.63346  ORF Transcript_20221/g.63346 Transcript_20221/m.63346 type:complete len:402 (+) Transcript_20221:59-1264(+)